MDRRSLERISNIIKVSVQTDKDDYFATRTNKHIECVKSNALKVAEYNPEFKEFDSSELVKNVEKHDASKFAEPEKTPYTEITWRHKTDNYKSYKTPGSLDNKAENEATLHHVCNNKHHPEYWLSDKGEANINKDDRDKSDKCVDATKMSSIAVAEMVCDWQAMSAELKTNTAREWFNKQQDVRWHFSDEQVELIDKLLKVFE